MSISERANTPYTKRAVMEALLASWEKRPELRFGQLLENARDIDLFYIEDMKLADLVATFVERSR